MLACGTVGSSDYSTKTDHPIDFAIGNKFFRDTDYRGLGGFPILFTRTYNSLDLGWRFSYTQRIDSLGVGKVAVRRPGGQSYEFQLINGQWRSDTDVTDRLEALKDKQGSFTGWRYTLSGNRQERFDENGRLTAIQNGAGLIQTLAYSTGGKTVTITAPEGDTLQLHLADNGYTVQSLTDSQGRTRTYTYDGTYLTQVTDPNGTYKQYLYEKPDRPWLITGIIDENGHRSHTVDYDEQGRAIMSELADGAERVDISYGSDGTTTVTNALGKKTRFHFETIHGVRKIVKVEGEPTATCQGTAMAYQFDDNGFLIEKIDAEGNITQYTRDTNGLALSQIDAKGQQAERTVHTEWDTDLRKLLVITEARTETRYTYDEQGRTLSRTLIDRQSGEKRVTAYTYNEQGLLATIDGPREDVADMTAYHYDSDGRLTEVINALGHATSIVSRDAYGRPLTTKAANALVTLLTYDEKGRIISRTVGSEVTAMDYDAVGNLIKVTAPDGSALTYTYDAANRLIGMADGTGNRITYTLDAMGNKTGEQVTDKHGQLTRMQRKTYDELGRLLKTLGADGQTTTYGYDRNDNLTRTIDPLWQMYENAYDGLNRLIEQTDPLGGVTSYGYDRQDRLVSVTDPNDNATTYAYDGLGNLTAQHSPDTGTTRYTHDSAGNVTSKTDANGWTTAYRYDALNRLTQTAYADDVQGCTNVAGAGCTGATGTIATYTYDTCTHGIGRLCALTNADGNTAWEYDSHGRTTARVQNIVINEVTTTLKTEYHYHSTGKLSGMTYPSGMHIGYEYSEGKISAVNINGEPLLSALTYQPFGPVTGWTWTNGSQSRRGYDLDGRLISQNLGNTARTLSYDANGNITAVTEPADNQAFDYDALNRLTAANDATFNLAWDYDANGNRLSETREGIVTPYTIETLSNRLMAVGGTAYQYDANGNLIHDGERSYQYNAQNRLTTVDEGATAEYRYNALGQRIYKRGTALPCDINGDGDITHDDLKQVTGKDKIPLEATGPGKGKAQGKGQSIACIVTQMNNGQGKRKEGQSGSREILFSYDEHRLLGEYDAQGNPVQETLWLGNLPVATIQNGKTYAIHADHLGTPRVITDSDNIAVWRWDSDPFGVVEADEDPDGDGVSFIYNLRFAGQYFDSETGLHCNYFRDYEPSSGRYTSSDPIGLEGGVNTYTYVGANPIALIDVYGLSETTGEFMDYFITGVNVNSIEQKSYIRFENGKQYLADLYINGSVSRNVTIKCKDTSGCGDTKYRYITQKFGTPNLTIKKPIEDSPFSYIIGPGGIGALGSGLRFADKAAGVGDLMLKYQEMVNHKYTKAAATLICRTFPNRNDGLPYDIDIAP